MACCGVFGYFWWLVGRYFLYLLKCGHIAVLTSKLRELSEKITSHRPAAALPAVSA